MKRKNPLSENATKGDLLKLEFKLTDLEQRLDSKAQKYRDQILTKLDETMGELRAMREENIIGSAQTSQLRDTADNHEKRIKNIEKIQQTSPLIQFL